MLLSLASHFFVSLSSAEVGEDEASLALSNAEEAVFSAFQTVLKAEEAGANVSGLLVQLNDAGKLLVEAHAAYRVGDVDEVARSASLCSEIAGNVKSQADDLWVKSYGSSVMGLWLVFAGSMVGVVVVGLGSFWSWRIFKRRYYRRVLGMKPEVNSDES